MLNLQIFAAAMTAAPTVVLAPLPRRLSIRYLLCDVISDFAGCLRALDGGADAFATGSNSNDYFMLSKRMACGVFGVVAASSPLPYARSSRSWQRRLCSKRQRKRCFQCANAVAIVGVKLLGMHGSGKHLWLKRMGKHVGSSMPDTVYDLQHGLRWFKCAH